MRRQQVPRRPVRINRARSAAAERILGDYPAMSSSLRLPAAQLWQRILSRVTTHFGRLIFLSGLHDGVTGRYAHDDLARLLGLEEADRTIRRSHHQVFAQWLGFSLADQKADLDEYLGPQPDSRLAPGYRNLAPPTARDVERRLYLTDLETLLELRDLERAASMGGAASPRR
jgi:hypothetical protein